MVLCDELLHGTDDLVVASNAAYTKTLKPFHNFVNRGAYAVSIRSDGIEYSTSYSLGRVSR